MSSFLWFYTCHLVKQWDERGMIIQLFNGTPCDVSSMTMLHMESAKKKNTQLKYLDLLKGSQKIKHIHYRFPSHGGFSIGKINNHLKQTQEYIIVLEGVANQFINSMAHLSNVVNPIIHHPQTSHFFMGGIKHPKW